MLQFSLDAMMAGLKIWSIRATFCLGMKLDVEFWKMALSYDTGLIYTYL